MKATVYAAVLSLSVLSLPIHASPKSTSKASITPVEQSVQKINLNQANVKQLSKSFKGIGKKRAVAIIKYRDEHKGFKSIAELAQVPGVGKRFVKTHLDQLQAVFTIN